MADVKYVAYTVTERGDGDDKKSFWTRIGVAYENRDGSLGVLLDALPTNGKLVLQTPKQRPEADDAS